ncbi:ComEC/Rec2 family competence protein [Sulfurimonas sp.]|uniref:ComEC/Rec2 family competence protein n=1 Tax=Sulfurimonas sp. TaxID=2022749 RepID=UPI003D107361
MIERVELFQRKKDLLFLAIIFTTLLTFSLLYEYSNYKQVIKFDSAIVDAQVLRQYNKTKITKTGKTKSYQVLKLKSSDGFIFYTTVKKDLPKVHSLELEIFTGKLGNVSFYDYLKGFYAYSKILQIYNTPTLKEKLSQLIQKQHTTKKIAAIYEALYLAKPLPLELQKNFSNLGIMHLIAISGFHLGILSAVLFFLLKYPYRYFHNNFFPYRSYKVDSFIIISLALLLYTIFLDAPPSLLRAFVMLVIGFFLYDRGIKIISMQTLLLTVLLILALFPRLFFAIGFWLSVSGVGYIFLFFIYAQNMRKLWQFLLLPIFVYLMMLPYSLALFGNFSSLHPASIIFTTLFTLFYPLSIILHILGVGGVLDGVLLSLVSSGENGVMIYLNMWILYLFIAFSFASIFNRFLFYSLNLFAFFVFIYGIYNLAQF